jgi:hypothetical protein
MPRLKIKLRDVRGFEAEIAGGIRRMTRGAMDAIQADAQKLVQSVINRISRSSEYNALLNDERVRGLIGFPLQARSKGGDTTPEDLIKLLQETKVQRSKGVIARRLLIQFPSIRELIDKLVINLSVVEGGTIKPGRTQSWFRWWEFGNSQDVDSLTVFRSSASAVKNVSRRSLTALINKRSRGGEAIQLVNQSPNHNSFLTPALVVSQAYDNFARVYPARVGNIVRNFVRKTNTGRFGFFSRSRVN